MQSELNKIPENEQILSDFHETWEMFGKTLQSAHKAAFSGPIDVQKILERASRAKDMPAPAKEPRRRFYMLRRYAEVSAICAVLLIVGVFTLRGPDNANGGPLEELSWESNFEGEIEEITMFLEDMDQGRSTFGTEIALMDARLDTIFDSIYGDDWEEDYF